MDKHAFNWRILVSFGLTVALIMMLLSGAVLFVSPPGRVANWSGWRMLGLTKSEWQEQHIIFGLAFGVLSLFHLLLFNWKLFLSYLHNKVTHSLQHLTELVVMFALTIILALGTLFHWQPFSGIVEFGRNWSGSWETPATRPPVPHAETLTLEELAALPRIGSTPRELLAKLRSAGLKVEDTRQTLQQIARANGKEASAVFALLDAGRRVQVFSGASWKSRSLSEAAEAGGVSVQALRMALRQQGVEARPDETLEEISGRNNVSVKELLERIETIVEKR